MELSDALRKRRMVRRHTGQPVDAPVLETIASAAARAPSAGWAQGVTVILVTDPERIAQIARACGEPDHLARGFDAWLSTAAAHLVVCVEPDRYLRRYTEPGKDPSTLDAVPWWWVDGGAALMAVLLAAVDAGVAAGFLGGHRTADVHELLGIPRDVRILGIVTLGPEGGDRRPPSAVRRRRTDTLRRDHW